MSKKLLVIFILGLCFSTSQFSIAETTYPLTLIDELGREVTMQTEPKRIISMVPAHTETLCALGEDICKRLVGIDNYSNYPDLPTVLQVGSIFNRDTALELIVALKPDLVLIFDGATSHAFSLALDRLGIVSYGTAAQTYDETFEVFEALGLIVNRSFESQTLIDQVKEEINVIEKLVENQLAPKVYYELGRFGGLNSVGPNSYLGSLMTKAGGQNIVSEQAKNFPTLDPEFVVAANPDVIILGHSSTLAELAARPGWSNITAVKKERVYVLSQEQIDTLNRSGPRISEAVKTLATIFYPYLFKDDDNS